MKTRLIPILFFNILWEMMETLAMESEARTSAFNRKHNFGYLQSRYYYHPAEMKKRTLFAKSAAQKSLETSIINTPHEDDTQGARVSRFKREIFGVDERSLIPPGHAGTKFPFNTTVKIWTPKVHCSGVLITHWHVLTAAHCLHNGKNLMASISAIQVATLQTNGKLTYSSVIDFFIPPPWTSGKDENSEYDYAILRISEPLYGAVMKMRPLNIKGGSPIQFASFPEDKSYGSVWFVKCHVTKLLKDTRMACNCDAFSGSSGAGIYVMPPFNDVTEPTIVGVLSNAWTLMYGWKPVMSANMITRINQQHYRTILRYISQTKGV